jgi:hypothetical protein
MAKRARYAQMKPQKFQCGKPPQQLAVNGGRQIAWMEIAKSEIMSVLFFKPLMPQRI